jgi:hypothetical protein
MAFFILPDVHIGDNDYFGLPLCPIDDKYFKAPHISGLNLKNTPAHLNHGDHYEDNHG